MSRRAAAVVLAALAAALLGACATQQGQVVLLPNPQGRATAVIVTQDAHELLLAQPYAGAALTSRGPQLYRSNAQDVQDRFGAALAAQPQPPADFTLYFVDGRDMLTDESQAQVERVFAEIAKRPVPDVVVVGHTDTVGGDAYNDALSLQRAEVLRTALIARGIAPDQVLAVGRGKRELRVPTADGVAEPRNRRVEIEVR